MFLDIKLSILTETGRMNNLFDTTSMGLTPRSMSKKKKKGAAKKLGFSPVVKITAALRQLAYGYAADCVDEYLEMSESSALLWLKKFCQAVIEIYEEEYMRSPNANDVERLLKENEKRGFPGMLGSIDCMHWVWKNCPTAWHGQYVGKEGVPTIVLEAVASNDLWFWYLVLNEHATRYRQTLITTQNSFVNKIQVLG